MIRAIFFLPLLLTACAGDETISQFVDSNAEFRLIELAGDPFPASATIGFPGKGLVSGHAPCNSYSAEQTAPYPWFALGAIRATRVACADASVEARFFDALDAMSQVEVSGNLLILRDDNGLEMVFTSAPNDGK